MGIPVTANHIELERLILQCMKDPSSSLHGSNINCWDVSQVTNMSYTFSNLMADHPMHNPELDLKGVASFSDYLDCWDTSSVEDMQGMFAYAQNFDKAIGAWDVSSVRDMSYMFAYSSFNQ
jgi:hypothetical protein